MLAIVYPYKAPGFPPKPGTSPTMDYPPTPLEDILSAPHYDAATVLCPIEWPSTGPAFRPRKPWMLDPRAEHTPYRLVMLDYDTEGHRAWRSTSEAAGAVRSLHAAVRATFGAALTYASRRGVRSLFLTPAPVPLWFADSWLSAALQAAPIVSGLAPPDKLTWTTGHRPPWLPTAGAPWLDAFPPTEATPFPPVATWEPPHGLEDERGRLQTRLSPLPVSTSALDPLAWGKLKEQLDYEVSEMVATLHASTARHPTLFGLARKLGGYLSRVVASEAVVNALVTRYGEQLIAAAPDSSDAARTVRDGIEAGWGFPLTLPEEQVNAMFGGDE